MTWKNALVVAPWRRPPDGQRFFTANLPLAVHVEVYTP
jgi:hypothetical protein